MVKHFHIVNDNLFRGAAPSTKDLLAFKRAGIKKIISLDGEVGNNIAPICKLLKMEQIIIPIDAFKINTLKHLLKYNICELIQPNKATYIHCARGKDRTGLLVAMYRCLFDKWCCKDAVKEAKEFGFGTGLDLPIEKFYIKLITRCCSKDHVDENSAYDIVSNIYDSDSSYRDYTLTDPLQLSWHPAADYAVRKYPEGYVNKYFEEQYPTRDDYGLKGILTEGPDYVNMPSVGVYDQNTQGIVGFGPSMVGSGFI